MKINFLALLVLSVSIMAACGKKSDAPNEVLNLLTSKEWKYDTLLINLPAKYENLNEGDKKAYSETHNSYKGVSFIFKSDGTFVSKEGGIVEATTTWKFVNGGKDIEIVTDPTPPIETEVLPAFAVTKDSFSCVQPINGEYDATYVFK